MPSVKTGGCSRNQISSGVSAERSSVKRFIASHVGWYSTSPSRLITGSGGGVRASMGCSTTRGERAVVEARIVAIQRLFRAIARAHERPRHTFEKAARQRPLAIAIELLRRDESLHGKVIHRRAQV